MDQSVVLPDGDVCGSTADVQTGRVHHLAVLEVAEVTGKGHGFGLQSSFTGFAVERMLQPCEFIEVITELNPHASVSRNLVRRERAGVRH